MYEYRKMTPEERQAILAEREDRGYPLHSPPHFRGIPGVYLITAACFEHRHIFNSPNLLSYLTDEILGTFLGAKLPCHAWIFLPNHYHILLELTDLSILSEPLRIVHSRIAKTVNEIQASKGRRVWYRYSDRLIRGERHYWNSVNYIHYNPIKHGYIELMSEWLWSSIYVYETEIGREGLQRLWTEYSIKSYAQGWDE